MSNPKAPLLPHQPIHLGGYIRLCPMHIVRLGAERNYTFIYREDGTKILISVTLKKVEELLKPSGMFIRVNRKDAVNINYIQKWNSDGTLVLKNGELITPSRRRFNGLEPPPMF